MTLWIVLGFLGLVALLVALDVGVFGRRQRAVTPGEALLSTELWVVAAFAASLGLFRLYEADWIPVDHIVRSEAHAFDAWIQFITAYLVEIALSLDNIAVLALILAHFHVPDKARPRMLFYVFLSCLVARAGLIAAGASVLHWPWMHWVFVPLLLAAAVRTFIMPGEASNLDNKLLVRAAHKLTEKPDPAERGPYARFCAWLHQSPQVVLVLVAAAADFSFALDSIPAVFSVTTDPFVAFTSNVLAILSLRSLYFSLAGVIGRLRYLKIGLVAVLLSLAVKMAVFRDTPVPTLVTLGSLVGIMGLAIAASIPNARRRRRELMALEEDRPTPLEDVTEAVVITKRNLRKLAILVAGSLVLLIAVLIGPLPGPGFLLVAPIGIAILATEFVWARTLLRRLETLQAKTDTLARKTPMWLVPVVVVGFWAAVGAVAWILHEWRGISPGLVFMLLGGGFLPIGFWAYRKVAVWRAEKHASAKDPPASASTHSPAQPPPPNPARAAHPAPTQGA